MVFLNVFRRFPVEPDAAAHTSGFQHCFGNYPGQYHGAVLT